jgi:cytochrome c556
MTNHRIARGRVAGSLYALAYASLLMCLCVIFAARSLTAADEAKKAPPAAPPASQYAPAADLIAQVNYYIKRSDEGLASKEDFDDAAKARLKKDANTMAVLGLALALHDSDNAIKSQAGELIKAAQALAKAQDFDVASLAFADLKKAATGSGAAAPNNPKEWQKVASLGQLMKQVPTVNTALKRGVSSPARLEKLKDESAGHAATLAAIAQASMADTHEVKNPADLDKWYEYCAEMRDAAGQVNAAVRALDHAKTTSAMLRLTNSCDTCHKVFRKGAH